MNIQDEINQRVAFKMNDVLSSIKNQVGLNWQIALNQQSQKHQHYWEAYEVLEKIIQKEIHMGTPYDNMAQRKKDIMKSEAVEKIMKRLDERNRGRIDYDHYTTARFIANRISEAQL